MFRRNFFFMFGGSKPMFRRTFFLCLVGQNQCFAVFFFGVWPIISKLAEVSKMILPGKNKVWPGIYLLKGG